MDAICPLVASMGRRCQEVTLCRTAPFGMQVLSPGMWEQILGGGGLSDLSSVIMFYFYSLKLECEKLATEKTEIQRHYVMVSENFLCTARV